ncbi:putative ribonuclease H-like domain-containing protein, partial [Tanacetum coccineum]
KDGSLFDSSSKNASNDEPQPSSDVRKKDDEGTNGYFFGDETEVDMSNITTTYPVPSTPNTRIHKYHSLDHVIGDVQSGVQTRRMTKITNEQGFISAVYEGRTCEDLHTCLFACFLSQEEHKKVWTLVDLPYNKRAIGTKWVYRNKKDERVARIEVIRLFLAYASFKEFVVYQMDVKSAFLSTKMELCTEFKKLMHKMFQMSSMAYTDSDYTGASLDRKSTTGGCQFLGSRLISWQCKKQTIVANSTNEKEYVATASCYGQNGTAANNEIQVSVVGLTYYYALTVNPTIYTSCIKQFWATAKAKTINGKTGKNGPQKKQPRRKQRKDTKVPQPSGSIEPITDEAANEEHVPTHSNDPLFSGEDRLQLKELLKLCTKLSERVLDLENTKTSQAAEITKLKERVKKLERRNKSRTPRLKRLRKVGRSAQVVSSKDEGLGAQEDAFKQGRKIADLDADAEEVEVKKAVSTAEVTTVNATTTVDELTLAQTLIEIKAAKPKAITTVATTTTTAVTRPMARGVVVQEPSEFRTTKSSSQISQLPQAKDKGKEKMTEPNKPFKKKDQILINK